MVADACQSGSSVLTLSVIVTMDVQVVQLVGSSALKAQNKTAGFGYGMGGI